MSAVAVVSSVSYIEPRATVSYTEQTKVRAVASYVDARFMASYKDIIVFAEATFPDRLLVEVFTPADEVSKSLTKARSDQTNGFTEHVTRGIGKVSADSVVMEDDTDIEFVLGKILKDIPLLSDAKIVLLAKALVDMASASDASARHLTKVFNDSNISFSDVQTVAAGKNLSDSATITESIYAVRLFVREFVESLFASEAFASSFTKAPFELTVATNDSDTYSLSKLQNESVVMIDNMDGDIQYQVVKVIGELISTSNDQLIVSVAAGRSDSISTSSSGVAFTTNYADISYFAADYVGVSSTFS